MTEPPLIPDAAVKPDASPQQRWERGRARRRTIGRQQHARWDPKLRRSGVLELLDASMSGRLPELVPEKYRRMALSPFAFFRGAVPVMAADLALMPNSGIVNQICGDAHVRNLGAYAAVDGRMVFDINDFDETTRAPFEWELKRMAASLVLAGREAGAKGTTARQAALCFLQKYRELIRHFTSLPVLEVARFQVHRLRAVGPVGAALLKAERATPQHLLKNLTLRSAGGSGRVFRETPNELMPLSKQEKRRVLACLEEYSQSMLAERRHILEQFRVRDICFKVVGTGSVGMRDYCVYLEGNGSGDPLFLQIKEETASAYTPYLPKSATVGAKPPHWGRLVAEGQRAMQLQSDLMLGWTSMEGRSFVVRQLNDHKASIDVSALTGRGLAAYAELCGELLARGHARSGDPHIIAGYIGRSDVFLQAVADFAVQYADQTEADWELLRRSGKASCGHGRSRSAQVNAAAPKKKSPSVR